MKKTTIIEFYSLIFLVLLFASCETDKTYTAQIKPNWEASRTIYNQAIVESIAGLDSLKEIQAKDPKAKEIFKRLRIAFKKAEPYASYLNPAVGHRVNGPALPIYKEDNGETMNPIGLQKIEESIYEGETSQQLYEKELLITNGLLRNLKKNIEKRELTAQRYFIATHQQLLRILSFSISGFDTPVSQLGISESAISLQNLYNTYQASIRNVILSKDKNLDRRFTEQIKNAIHFTNGDTNYETFDRYTFVRDHLTPITRSWVSIRKKAVSGMEQIANH